MNTNAAESKEFDINGNNMTEGEQLKADVAQVSDNKMSGLIQFIKYAIVGGMNTLLTMMVIYICKSILDINPYVSNAIGYGVGLINSFIWNRSWVFKAKDGKMSVQAVKFFIGFGLCYFLQFLIVWALNSSSFGQFEYVIFGFTLSGYGIATLIGMVVYTVCYYIYNRVFAFKTE